MKPWAVQPKNRKFIVILGICVLGILVFVTYNLMFLGRILPGTYLDGLAVGGLTKTQALSKVHTQAANYQNQVLRVSYGTTILQIPVATLSPTYADQTAAAALSYGRRGSWATQVFDVGRAFFGRPTYFSSVSYDDTKLTPYIQQVDNDVTAPVANATLSFAGGITVTPAQPGKRLDVGTLTLDIEQALGTMDASVISAPIYSLNPSVTTADLTAAKSKATAYTTAPLQLVLPSGTRTVDQNQIISWLDATEQPDSTVDNLSLTSFYTLPNTKAVDIQLDPVKVAAYVASLAATVDTPGQNAALGIQNGKPVVVQASQNGLSLEQPEAVSQITRAVENANGTRSITLTGKVTKPAINEDDLASLGINDLLSEGETFFPGSPSTRLTNVRIGAQQFNGVVLKPDETFSFGALLGAVGPAQGYVPELVILGNSEVKQYGGGLCQVSSTAFRAALLAGLPIVERVNHAFAISYYTAPFGVPGVDATIYYPQVDFKFKNDTGHYILIQTIMSGTTLKFDFYGTKTKSGVIRGPQFVSGSNDATQPSHTVFWRDVLDPAGNVIKTDQFDTYYKSSKDFPVTPQFN